MSKQTDDRPAVMDVNPDSPAAEAYRTLRANIEFSSVGREMKVIMVTSAQSGEGRTVTAANFAITLARGGKQVVVIDADLRKPGLHRIFHLDNANGLANFLALQTELPDIVIDTHIPNLHLIPAGTTPPNPGELLAMNRMDALLNELKPNCDIIVIDTPPMTAVTDAQIMAAKSDGVVLVVEYGRLKRGTARKVKAQLHHVNATLLGVVMNKTSRHKSEENFYQTNV